MRRSPEPRPYEEARRRLQEKFGDDVTDANTTLEILQITLDKWLGKKAPWFQLKGKNVLDLASGTASGDGFPPWFSRLCAVFEVNVTAVDIRPQGNTDKRAFTCVQADLIESVLGSGLGSIPALAGEKFDLIHSSRFVGFNPDGGAAREIIHRGISLSTFEDMLKDQASELLAPGGYIDISAVYPVSFP